MYDKVTYGKFKTHGHNHPGRFPRGNPNKLLPIFALTLHMVLGIVIPSFDYDSHVQKRARLDFAALSPERTSVSMLVLFGTQAPNNGYPPRGDAIDVRFQ